MEAINRRCRSSGTISRSRRALRPDAGAADKSRNEVEAHIDNPNESAIFQPFPKVLKNHDLTDFICDYCRLIIIGNARPHEIEALMDEEIQTTARQAEAL